MKIYIASSWKNQHAVELLTDRLRNKGHEVLSFVENNHGEGTAGRKPTNFDEWCMSEKGLQSFNYDTHGATKSDLVIYIGPSGCDAWAEVGAAWASGVTIYALVSKGEQVGLMRRMASWFKDYRELLAAVDCISRCPRCCGEGVIPADVGFGESGHCDQCNGTGFVHRGVPQ